MDRITLRKNKRTPRRTTWALKSRHRNAGNVKCLKKALKTVKYVLIKIMSKTKISEEIKAISTLNQVRAKTIQGVDETLYHTLLSVWILWVNQIKRPIVVSHQLKIKIWVQIAQMRDQQVTIYPSALNTR